MGQERAGRSTYTSRNSPTDDAAAKAVLPLVTLAGAALAVVPAWNRWIAQVACFGDLTAMLVCGSIGLAAIGWSLYAWGSVGPRTWEWDAGGIAFRGPRGERYLRWDDVERVRWRPDGVALVGRGGRIDLPWDSLKRDRRAEARGELLRILRADFDLPGPPARGEKRPLPWLLYAELLVGILWMGLAQWIALHAAYQVAEAIAPLARDLVRDKELFLLVLIGIWGLGYGLIVLGLTLPLLIRWGSAWYDRRLTEIRDHRDPR